MEITSLSKRGWSISAIARHTGRDRKTVRAYLIGEAAARRPGPRAPDPLDRFEPYVRQRFVDDPHVWATALFDEVVALGYVRAYPTFTRQLRDRGLRPHCEACAASNGRAHVEIEHPAGEEIQWDWLELDATPWGAKAFVLVGGVVALVEVPGVVLRVRRPGASGRGDRRGAAPPRWHRAPVARRPDGHGDPTGHE